MRAYSHTQHKCWRGCVALDRPALMPPINRPRDGATYRRRLGLTKLGFFPIACGNRKKSEILYNWGHGQRRAHRPVEAPPSHTPRCRCGTLLLLGCAQPHPALRCEPPKLDKLVLGNPSAVRKPSCTLASCVLQGNFLFITSSMKVVHPSLYLT